MAINSGFSHEKLWFSIVMLVYQRVTFKNSADPWKKRDTSHSLVSLFERSLLAPRKGRPAIPSPMFAVNKDPRHTMLGLRGMWSVILARSVYIYIYVRGGVLCHWGTPSSHPCDFVIFGFSIFSPIQLLGFPHNLGNPHIYSIYPLVNQHNYGKSPCLKCKSTN